MYRLKAVGSSVFAFMSLFDDVKKLLTTNDSHDGMVDVDMKGSIFGKSFVVLTLLILAPISHQFPCMNFSVPYHVVSVNDKGHSSGLIVHYCIVKTLAVKMFGDHH